MKFKAMIVALAACASLYGGTGVTERRMTNYVSGVTTALSNNLAEVIRQSTPDDYATVRSLAQNAATKTELVAGVSNIIDYISADNEATEPVFNANGTITIIHIDTSSGYPRRVPITLRMHYGEVFATNRGFRVVSTSYDGVTVGQLFACVGASSFYNSSFGYLNYEKVSTTNNVGESVNYYRVYRDGSPLSYDSSDAYLNSRVQVYSYNGTPSLENLVGTFTIEPYNLSDEEYAEVASGRGKGTNEWTERAPTRSLGVSYWWEQISPTRASFRRKFRLMDLFVPSAYADGEPPTFYVPITPYPMADRVNWEERYPDHADDEYWEPKEWYLAADWNNPYNWIVFPLEVSVAYEYDGEWYTIQKKCSTIEQLRKYYPNLNVPPSPYQQPQLKKKKDYCKEGQHIYVNCVCSKCGHERAHSYDPCNEWDTSCARCKNLNTTVKTDEHGDLAPDTDSGARCTQICEDAVVMYHAGWHHQYLDEADLYNCSCKCGVFSSSNYNLQHAYSETEGITVWHDAHDGETHYGIVTCQRGYCDHEHRIYKDHEIVVITNSEGVAQNVWYYDSKYHQIYGDCAKCEARDVPDHLQEHDIVLVEEGEDYIGEDGNVHQATHAFCYCKICRANSDNYEGLHSLTAMVCKDEQSPVLIYCSRCGWYMGGTDHDFSENKPVDDEYHECFCGLDLHQHIVDETSKKCVGGKHWYTDSDEFGNVWGNWVEVKLAIDDGCGRDFNDDEESHGTKNIQCWNGKDAPDDPDENAKHVVQGAAKTTSQSIYTINDSCPYHTKNISNGGFTTEWEDPSIYWWHPKGIGGISLSILPVPIPVQWGTRYYNGSSTHKPASFRVVRMVSWGEWQDSL